MKSFIYFLLLLISLIILGVTITYILEDENLKGILDALGTLVTGVINNPTLRLFLFAQLIFIPSILILNFIHKVASKR